MQHLNEIDQRFPEKMVGIQFTYLTGFFFKKPTNIWLCNTGWSLPSNGQ
jgi:hypothetical protein